MYKVKTYSTEERLKDVNEWLREGSGTTLLNLQKEELHFTHLLIQQLPQSQEHSMYLINVNGMKTCLKASTKPPGLYTVSKKEALSRYFID